MLFSLSEAKSLSLRTVYNGNSITRCVVEFDLLQYYNLKKSQRTMKIVKMDHVN